MYPSKISALILMFLLRPIVASPLQSGGRFEEAKRTGMSYIQSEQFDKASGRLEEVWEQDQSDPVVGEFLAIAYLNTEDRRSLPQYQKQAFAIIDKLVSSNAQVTFLVIHSHEKLGWLQGREMNQYCRGSLSIQKHRLIYVADKGEKKAQHSFDIDATQFKSITLHDNDERGTFELKLKDGSYFMATRNRNQDEARVIVDLVRRQLGS
jgi:hypothetical protein